ncbi:MAG: PorV/PorQ family protein [Candidatus Cloacimonetes bacterium]|nr:PorV/PorQ family protein [Candidatus Cloacimonadota bacterium]
MKKYIITLLIVVLLPGLLIAEIFPKTGTAGLQFLKLGVDARAIGMGEAYTAVSDDISSVYWNPAGLALKSQNQLLFSHTQYVAGIMHEYFAASKLLSFGALAFSASVLHMDWMDVYEEESFDQPTGEQFTCSDIAMGLTYASSFTDKFSFGATIKYLRQNLDEYDVNGIGVDLGSLYNTGWKNFTIGMSLRNFGPNLKYELDDDNDGSFDEDPFDLLDNDGDGLIDEDIAELEFKIPMNFSLGVAADLYERDNSKLIGAFQLDNCVDRTETYNLGFEYQIGVFSARSGYQFNYDAAGLSLGFGLTIPTNSVIVQFDYSYTSFGYLQEDFINTPHRISIKLLY